MAKIKLNLGHFALVDDEDFDKISSIKWLAIKPKRSHTFYAVANKQRKFPKNGNRLDNRKENLRICTKQQNAMNIGSFKVSKTSKFKGVSFE